jgi:PAS domain S-box-containing protein
LKNKLFLKNRNTEKIIIFCLIIFSTLLSIFQQRIFNPGTLSGKMLLKKEGLVFNSTNKKIADDAFLSGKMENQFSAFSGYKIPDGFSEHWIKLVLHNNDAEQKKYYIGTSRFDFIDFYIPADSGKWQIQHSGTNFPHAQKKIVSGPVSFADVIIPAQKTVNVYLKTKNLNGTAFQFVPLDLTLFTEKQFRVEYDYTKNYNLVFLGIVIIMALYNFILYFITRERSYLYYVGYNLFILSYVFALSGEAVTLFYPDGSKQQDLVLYTGMGALFFYALFARNTLDYKKHFPFWDKVLIASGFLTAFMAIPTWLGWSFIAIPICFATAFITYPTILVTAIILARKKNAPASYFVVAATFLIIFLIVSFLQMLQLFPVSLFGLQASTITQIGVSFELALLSLALGARIISIREKTLKESEQRLSQYFEAMPVGVYVVDKNGHPSFVNRYAVELMGQGIDPNLDPKEIATVHHAYKAGTDEIYPTEELPGIKALNGIENTLDDMQLQMPDNKKINIEASGRPIYDEDNKIIYAITTFQDITQRLQAKKQLEEYSQTLEQKVAERTEQINQQKNEIEIEKQKSESLLLSILPEEIAEELKATGKAKPHRFEKVSVLFTDFVDFSMASELITPDELLNEINYYFSAFDEIISKYKLEKIKTIGDSYMCAGGLPVPDDDNPINTVAAAMEIKNFIVKEKEERQASGRTYFDCRIGVHTGPVIAGIIGTKKFSYDIWGNTVNIASQMENRGVPNKVNMSGVTYEYVKQKFDCTYRGKIESKHERLIDMYLAEEKLLTPEYENAEKFIFNRLYKELPPTLLYHGPHHTPDVMNAAMIIAETENLNAEEISLLRVAVAYHDCGFIYIYKDHEERGCEIARESLPSFGFSEKQIEIICGMIMATKIPQTPKNKLEEIIGDADLDYLGREDVYPIAQTLFDELKVHANLTDEKKWDEIQIDFLKIHKYHTNYSLKKRNPPKQQYLDELIKKWNN